jgi:predicted TIM-barrel fold metal-dependent hydrolase
MLRPTSDQARAKGDCEITRREFLTGAASVGLAAALPPVAVWAAQERSSTLPEGGTDVDMRIDAHLHGDFSKLKGSPADYVEKCRRQGIERGLLIGEPKMTLEAYRAMPDFIIPVPRLDIDKTTPKEIGEVLDAGALGIKFIDPQFSYGDTRYDPLYQAISGKGKVVMFHTGYLARRNEPRRPTDITLMRPAAVDCMSRRHPDLKILMAHFGNPWWEEAWKILWSVPTCYAELSGGTAYKRSISMWAEIFAPNGVLDGESFGKLLFATDMSLFREKEGFEPYFEFYDKLFDAVKAPPEMRARVNRGNALKLFALQ